MPRALALALALASLLAARGAAAECPAVASREPARGFLAHVVSQVMPGARSPAPAPFEISGAATAEVRHDTGDPRASPVAAAMRGEARIERGSVRGCAAGSLAIDDVTSGTASAGLLVPLLYSGLGAGVTLTYRGILDLAARPQWLARRLSEVQTHISVAFVDIPLASGQDRARVQVMPVAFEVAHDLDGAGGARGGREVVVSASMMRFAVDSPGGRGSADVFGIASSWVELDTEVMTEGTLRVSLVRFEVESGPWSYGLGGAFVLYDGTGIDCETQACARGAWSAHLLRRFGAFEIGARTARQGFTLWDGRAGYEDRLALETALSRSRFTLRGDGFVARTTRWLGPSLGTTAGIGGELVVPLGAGFAGRVRADLARSFYAEPTAGGAPAIAPTARLGAALSWSGGLAR